MKTREFHVDLPTPVGIARIEADENAVTSIDWVSRATEKSTDHPVLRKTIKQLMEYFNGGRKSFDIPLQPEGTQFQKLVWKLCAAIPYGSVATYGDLARRSRHSGAARAVGGAMAANPIPILIPCHRVLGCSGLGGYSGPGGLDMKRFLLDLENNGAHTKRHSGNQAKRQG